jgi:hypothetical protein
VKISRESSLLKDTEWSAIDGEFCRVNDFVPLSWMEEGKICDDKLFKTLPYASVILECKKIPNRIKGYITHKIDFIHLWNVFRERGIKEDEEVIIIWTIQNYKWKWLKYFSVFLPKIWVSVHHKGFLEFITDQNWHPESKPRPTTEEMLTPIVSRKPKIME